MFSSKYRFIYLHAPKTGGNSIQTLLLPLADDSKFVEGHQDGIDRFGIRGPVTKGKHAMLNDYFSRMGQDIGQYRTVISVRNPYTAQFLSTIRHIDGLGKIRRHKNGND